MPSAPIRQPMQLCTHACSVQPVPQLRTGMQYLVPTGTTWLRQAICSNQYIVSFFLTIISYCFEGFFFTHAQKIIRQGLRRLNVFQRPGNDSHRVRHENLERSIKKIKTFYWKRKKLEHVEVGIWKFLRSKIFKIFDLKNFHFHTVFNENFRVFSRFSI